MNWLSLSFLISLLTFNLMAEAKPSRSSRCDAKDALMAEVYKDSWFSLPENHKKRDELIKKIATDQNICKYFYWWLSSVRVMKLRENQMSEACSIPSNTDPRPEQGGTCGLDSAAKVKDDADGSNPEDLAQGTPPCNTCCPCKSDESWLLLWTTLILETK